MLSSHSSLNDIVTLLTAIKKTWMIIHAKQVIAEMAAMSIPTVQLHLMPTTTIIVTPPVKITELTKNKGNRRKKNLSAGLDLMRDEGGLAGGEDGSEIVDVAPYFGFDISVELCNFVAIICLIFKRVVGFAALKVVRKRRKLPAGPLRTGLTPTTENLLEILSDFRSSVICGVRNTSKLVKCRTHVFYKTPNVTLLNGLKVGRNLLRPILQLPWANTIYTVKIIYNFFDLLKIL
ncbi:amino acid ABC transporter permease [Babesia caballi]|uniref:Amino acid ABC transporter permease n=1 Tax=Babesia caballi TaxID=5871 RepID=A0AAV4LT41_BABCB|nr:amino acid ABC transporter permease [Babesia caballi]